MLRYEQHCPVARAAEVVTEPWTLLVLRELMRGSERRSDIARGLPGMTQSLLAARLRTLERTGLVTHLSGNRGEKCYRLTAAGSELRPIVDHLGQWGQRWLPTPRVGDLDPELLLYDISREIAHDRLPEKDLTVQVEFSDAPHRTWLLELGTEDARVRACGDKAGDKGDKAGSEADPAAGQHVDVRLRCTLGALAGVWLGRTTWLEAVRAHAIVLVGDAGAVRLVIDCLGRSRYAPRNGES